MVDLFAVRYLWVVCHEDKCCVVTQRAADAWLVYVRTYCVPIATLNQTNHTEQAISEFQKISLSKRG